MSSTLDHEQTIAPLRLDAIQSENIPDPLKRERRWIAWRAGPIDAMGKFSKVPIDPTNGRNISALDPKNWLKFEDALAACGKGLASGIGIVLSDQHPITVSGDAFFLAAIDLDHCSDRMPDCQALWNELGQPYVEVSPSGKGLRMLGLSRTPHKGGNAGDGRELYFTKRFVTVTGWHARGMLLDISPGVGALEERWFPQTPPPLSSNPSTPTRPETKAEVARVLSMLNCVSPDIEYDKWRDIIWSVMSTGWNSAPKIVHDWSAKAPHRYNSAALDKLIAQFDPARGLTIGTLRHHAAQSGWQPGHVQQLLSQAPPPPPNAVRERLLTAAELHRLPSTPSIIKGLLPARGLGAIYGEPGSGKSFLAIDLAHALACARSSWFGLRAKQAPVVYVALEGQGGIDRRVRAVEAHTTSKCAQSLRFWLGDFSLMYDKATIEHFATWVTDTLGKGAVIIVDTLNQASPGADENTSQDMGRIITGAKSLATALEGLVILVHHSGKNKAQGLRGHSSLLAAMDVVIEVQREPYGRSWRIVKAKDDAGDVQHDFELVRHLVGQDDDGDPVYSCAVQQTVHLTTPKKKPIRGRNRVTAMAALSSRLNPPGQTIDKKDAVDQVASALSGLTKRPGDRAKDAVDALIELGHLSLTDGKIALPTNPQSCPAPNPIGGFGETGTSLHPETARFGNSGLFPPNIT